MRLIRLASIVLIVFWVAGATLGAAQNAADPSALVKRGIQALESGRPVLAKQELQRALEIDRFNYKALVLLGQLEMREMDATERAARILESERYLLLATIAQPNRPEAYLALAQLYYDSGYFNRGNDYARRAQSQAPLSYEAFCLLGQSYEDSGNYTGALNQYQRALQEYQHDSYFVDKRYVAASRGGLQPYRVQTTFTKGTKDQQGGTLNVLLPNFPDFFLLQRYRVAASQERPPYSHYLLPYFKFRYCEEERIPPRQSQDLYDAFLRASAANDAEYRNLKSKLDALRSQGSDVMKKATGPAAKARALFNWMKDKVLKEYDLENGGTAEALLADNRYLSLNASILYTLMANDAGLPVKGFLMPGHAFAMYDDGNQIQRIELIAEDRFGLAEEKGFNVTWWKQFELLNRPDAYGGLYGNSSVRNQGPLEKEELTAYQYVNMLVYGLDKITDKYAEEIKLQKTLREQMIENNREMAATRVELQGRLQREPDKLAGQLRRATDRHEDKQRRLQEQIDRIEFKIAKEKTEFLAGTGLQLMSAARAIAPDTEEFDRRSADIFVRQAAIGYREAELAIQDRNRRRLDIERKITQKREEKVLMERTAGTKSESYTEISQLLATLEAEAKIIDDEAKARWSEEKQYWLNAINTLETGLNANPCSTNLKRRLESLCWLVAKRAQRFGDPTTAATAIAKGTSLLPESEFAKRHRQQIQ